MSVINVTVVGFGNVGAAQVSLLLCSSYDLRINVMEPNPMREGAFLDINHGLTLYHNHNLHVNDNELFQDADFIFYTAGIPNKQGSSRFTTLNENRTLTNEIFGDIAFNKEPFIIVVTNPVDIISHEVYKITGLPKEHIIGTGTLLESVRMAYYLSQLTGVNASDLKTWVLGEHGDSQAAIFSMSTYKHEPVLENPIFTTEILDQAKDLTKNAAFHIRETQKGTSYAVVKCAEAIMEALLTEETKVLPVSVLIDQEHMDFLKIDKPIFMSLPTDINTKGAKLHSPKDYLNEELEQLRLSAKTIVNVAF